MIRYNDEKAPAFFRTGNVEMFFEDVQQMPVDQDIEVKVDVALDQEIDRVLEQTAA